MRLRTEKSTYEVKVEKNGEVANFTVNIIDPEENARLIKKHTPKKRWIGNTMEEKDPDYVALQIDRVDKTIVDWDIQDENGDPIPCTKENKRKVYLLNPDIILEVLDKVSELSKDAQKSEAEEVKN